MSPSQLNEAHVLQPGKISIETQRSDDLPDVVSAVFARLTSIHFDDRLTIRKLMANRAVLEQLNKSPYLLQSPTERTPAYPLISPHHGALVLAIFVRSVLDCENISITDERGNHLSNITAENIHHWDPSTPIKDILYVLNAGRAEKAAVSIREPLTQASPMAEIPKHQPSPALSTSIAVEEIWE